MFSSEKRSQGRPRRHRPEYGLYAIVFFSVGSTMSAHRDTAIPEQQMLKIAKEAILDSGDFLSLDQTAQQLGLLPSDVNKWKAEGQIFSIQHAGCSLFPKYAFHNNAEHKPVPSL